MAIVERPVGAAVFGERASSGDAPCASARTNDPKDACILRREADYWTIVYTGQVVRIRDLVGLRHLAQLLWHPEREFHVLELMRALTLSGASRNGRPPGGSRGPAIDAKAVSEYRQRIRDLEGEQAQAEALHDLSRTERLQREREAILRELRRVGRGRQLAADAERARVAVTKTLGAALGRIRPAHAVLASHLDATVKRGYVCVYRPDPRSPICWEC